MTVYVKYHLGTRVKKFLLPLEENSYQAKYFLRLYSGGLQLGQPVESHGQVVPLGIVDDLATLQPGKQLLPQKRLLNFKFLQNALVLSCSPGKQIVHS